jgi:hypothetical protein
MFDAPLDYGELAAHMARVGVIPRYTLHAHPSVITELRNRVGPSGERTVLDDMHAASLTGIDVFPERDWEPGRYELRKNGVVTLEGVLRDE